jgi:TolB-like protein
MKKMFAVIVCTAVCGAALFARQLTVAVSPFDVRSGFTHDDAEAIYELFTRDLVSTGKVNVVDRNSFNKIMAEMKFQTADWPDGGKVARLGNALNAGSIIRGQLMKLGDQLVITVNILDINTAWIQSSSQAQFREVNEAFDRISPLVNTVVGKLLDPYPGFDIRNNAVFSYNGRGGSVTIPAAVTSIGNYAFYGCTGLTSVTIPATVTSIEGYAFWGCTGLTRVELSRRTRIGKDAFKNVPGPLQYRD